MGVCGGALHRLFYECRVGKERAPVWRGLKSYDEGQVILRFLMSSRSNRMNFRNPDVLGSVSVIPPWNVGW